MSEVALATRFRCVDEVLHARTIHDKSCHERYPEEKFSQLHRQGLWGNSDGLQTLKSRIRASRLIPLHRKLYALTWLRLQALDLRSYPGGSLFHRLNRALARTVG